MYSYRACTYLTQTIIMGADGAGGCWCTMEGIVVVTDEFIFPQPVAVLVPVIAAEGAQYSPPTLSLFLISPPTPVLALVPFVADTCTLPPVPAIPVSAAEY